MSVIPQASRLTLKNIQALRAAGEKITMLTAYDYVTAGLLDQAGIELLLVGDSLGNVVLGYDTTIPVRLDDMIRHTAAVVRGTSRALVVCDLPFGVATDPEAALQASIRVFQETGCQAVKLEGGVEAAPIVKRLTSQGIPVVTHVGLTPQSIHQLGGFYRHGKTDENIAYLRESAFALQEAGSFALVLECVMPEVAARLTAELVIPTIGIGSGPGCSGQVLVINDLIGLGLRPAPKFARPRADVASIIRDAAADFLRETKAGEKSANPKEPSVRPKQAAGTAVSERAAPAPAGASERAAPAGSGTTASVKRVARPASDRPASDRPAPDRPAPEYKEAPK